MGRPPSNGGPTFRFNSSEVAEMEALLQKHEGNVPPRDLLVALANGFSNSPDRAGKVVIQMKQVWSWFQNRRCALRTKLLKPSGTPSTSPVTAFTQGGVLPVRNVHHAPQQMAVSSGSQVVKNTSEGSQMDFEAKSARDSAWYDVQEFISHRYLETDNPEVLVRFAGFGPEEDEWVNILKHVRQRSLPCEASECIVVTSGDLILCFQEGKEQALYFDAHVLDAQRRRHDVRGCRCRFLVHFDHDQSEEIVPLRKICRRPETDYRLQQLHTANEALSTSVSKEPPKPLVDDLTSTNTNPSAATIPVPLPPNVSAGPSVRPAVTQTPTPTVYTVVQALSTAPLRPSTPSPFFVGDYAPSPPPVGPPSPSPPPIGPPSLLVTPTSTLNSTSVPASPSPLPVSSPYSASLTLGVPEISELKKVESDIPAQCPLSIGSPALVVTPTPTLTSASFPASPSPLPFFPPFSASITVDVAETCESKNVESDIAAQCPLPEPKKAESDGPTPPESIKAENSNCTPIPELVKVQPDNPALAPLPAPKLDMIETDGAPQLVVVSNRPSPISLPEPNEVKSDDPALVSTSEPNKVLTDNPTPISVRASNNIESDDPAPVSILEPNKVSTDHPTPASVHASNKVDSADVALIPTPEASKVGSDTPATEPNTADLWK